MNIKQIVGAILMVIQTILGMVFILGIAIVININSNNLIKAIHKADYLATTSVAAKESLTHYMDAFQAEQILNEVSVKSQIKEIANAMDNNTIDKVAASISESMKEKVVASINDDVDIATKEAYAKVVTDAYMKTIFPTAELSLVSNIYTMYKTNTELTLIIIALVYAVIYAFLSMGKKTYKWEIVSLYNVVVLTSIIAIVLGMFNGIVIGNERTTAVISNLISDIRMDIIVGIILVFILSIVANYFAYFKKKKRNS